MRLRTLIIFGAGYVWGARAGRDPYADFVERVRGFLDSDLLRDYVDKARAVGLPADGATGQDEEWDEEVDDEGEPWDEEDEAEPWDEQEEADEEGPGESDGDEDEPDEEPARSRPRTRRRAPTRTTRRRG